MHLKDSPDCHNQNVELNGERVEPDRNCKDWINLLLVVAPFAGLDLERTVLHWSASQSWHAGLQKTLPKAQRTQGIEYFDSFNTYSSTSFEILAKFSLVCLAKGEEYEEQL